MALDDERSVRDQIQHVGAGVVGKLAAAAIVTFHSELIDGGVPEQLRVELTRKFANEAVKYYFLLAEEIKDQNEDDDEDEDDDYPGSYLGD